MAGLEDLLGLISVGAPQKAAIAASDPYLQFKSAPDSISQLLLSPQFASNPDYSLKDKAIAGLITGGLSGIFGGLSNDYQGRAGSAYTDVLQSFKRGETPTRPDVLDGNIFNMARDQAGIFNLGRELKAMDLKNEIVTEGLKKKAGAIGEITGRTEAYGLGANEDPESPLYKVNQDKISITRSLANDFTAKSADYKNKEIGVKALVEAYADPSGVSDFELIRRGAQAIEPGLAVRTDDQESILGAASVLGMTAQSVKAAITGDTKLTPEVRAGIVRLAKRSLNSSLDNYNTIRDSFLQRARDANVKPDLVVPFGPGKKFEEMFPNLDVNAGTETVPTPKVDPSSGIDLSGYRPDQIEFLKSEGLL